jgi:tRNA(Ile)-lysidine synthase
MPTQPPDILAKLVGFMAEHQLLDPADHLLLAVSGGLDSVVMAHLFARLPYPFALAHANFGLRGAESDGDEAFVRQLAQGLGVACHVAHLPAAEYAASASVSVQMAARQLRYEWFEQLRRREGLTKILTAHQQDDVVETLLYNLAKGTGIAGLHGIRPLSGSLVRPLLALDRAEVAAYAHACGLAWREDSSNTSDKYARNLIRHQVVPGLRQLNPQLAASVAESAEKIAAVERVFAREVAQFRARALTWHGDVALVSLARCAGEPELLIKLSEVLREFGFNYAQAKQVLAHLASEPGKQFLSPTHELVKDRDALVVCPRALALAQPVAVAETELAAGQPVLVGPPGASWQLQKLASPPPPVPGYLALSYAKLCFPLVLRPWQPGDWLVPTGLKGRKKVSDFLNDRKVPRNLKARVWVLVSGGDIAAVLGHRADERYRADAGEVLWVGPGVAQPDK